MDRRKAETSSVISSSSPVSRNKRRRNNEDNDAPHGDSDTTTRRDISIDVATLLGQSSSQRHHQRGGEVTVIDRALDVNKYMDNKQAPNRRLGLYELCRDWIYAGTSLGETARLHEMLLSQDRTKLLDSQANLITNEDSKNSPNNDKKSIENVYKLPDPYSSDESGGKKFENINLEIRELNAKLDSLVRPTQANDLEIVKTLNVADDERAVIQAHALLKLHVNRWKAARKEWTALYKRVNAPYNESESVLRSIFEELQ